MSDRRLAIGALFGVAALVTVGVSWVRVTTGEPVDTTAIFGLLTLLTIQIAKLGGSDD